MDEFDKALAEISEQGSNMWFDIRLGRFTSSDMHKLIKPGQRLMTDAELKARPKKGPGSRTTTTDEPTKFSEAGETYINEIVSQVLTGTVPPQVRNYNTEHGEEYEPYAAEFFTKTTGLELEICGFIPYGDHAGGSPDRKIVGANEGIEIKCPANSPNQIKYLMLSDEYTLKLNNPDYYWQAQSNLLFTGWDRLFFVTYDFRFKLPQHKMSFLEVRRNEKDIELLKSRLEQAIKEKNDILKTLNNIKPYSR